MSTGNNAGTNYFTPVTPTVEVAFTNNAGNATLIRCTAANLPTDGGYAIGCIAEASDSGVIYYNSGTTTTASFTAVNAGSAALTLPTSLADSTTTTGASLAIVADSVTSGSGLTISIAGATSGKGVVVTASTANFTTSGALFKGDLVAATAGNGLVIVTTGAYTGTGLATLTAGAMTTGVGLQVTSTTGLTSGSLIRATSSTAGAIATNGAISFNATGAYTSTTIGFLNVIVSAAVAGTGIGLQMSAASQTTGIGLNIIQTNTTTGFSGKVVSITGSHTTGGTTLLVTDVTTTTGDAVKIVANALTVGTATALNISHTTSVLGAGTSLARISSTGVDTGTTTGVLLDLSTTACVGSTQVLLTDASADTAARTDVLISVTNAAAVLAIPLKTSNVAVVNSKFTKHIVLTDGTYVGTVWLDQDATDPNGVVTGVAGDFMLNGPSHKPYYCTTTGTVWATVV